MQQSSVRTKILLIAASFSLPLGVLLYLTVANINLRIDFARKEMTGTAYLRPVMALLDDVQRYRMETPGAGCAQSAQRVEASLSRVEEAGRQYGSVLEFTPAGLGKRGRSRLTVDGVKQQWRDIQTAGCSLPDGKIATLIADIRGMINHAGDTSNLILDPDLDSYYLMDAVVIALPQTQTRQSTVLQDSGDRAKLGVHSAMLREADLERISASLKTAINEDANFFGVSPTLRGALTPAIERYEATAGKFATATAKAAAGEGQTEELKRAGVEAMTASYDLWRVAADELDTLLAARVRDSVQYRGWALGLAGLAIGAAYLLSWFFMRSITEPLDGLIRSLGPGASLLSECVNRISTVTGAETAGEESQIICEELNAHAEDMRKAVYQLSIHVNGAEELAASPVKG